MTWWRELRSRPSWIIQADPMAPQPWIPGRWVKCARQAVQTVGLYPGCTSLPLPTTLSFFIWKCWKTLKSPRKEC